jgi:galactan endo-1,6-beta-galactosidase
MPRILRIALFLCLAAGIPAWGDPPVVLDPAAAEGRWEGWGTSLSWWAAAFGARDDLADLLFTTGTVNFLGQPAPGLGLNIVRYNLGASSDSEVNGRHMVVGDRLIPAHRIQGFWRDGRSEDPGSFSWDWGVDANQRAVLLAARRRGVDRLELFANSPMWWMCKNGNPAGQEQPFQDNLAPEHFHDFAVYLATVALYARTHWGISFTSIEPFNEPSAKWWFAGGRQEGCCFSVQSQEAFLPLLRADLDKRGLRGLPIAASDEYTYDDATATWKGFSPAAQALVQRVNVHGYEGGGGRRDLLQGLVSPAGKTLWNSEYGDQYTDGLTMAANLNLDLRYLQPRAWCYWQPFDGDGWGLIAAQISPRTFQRINPKYYVLAQYTRHIRPGMTILQTNDSDIAAAYDPPARKLVLVICNGVAQPARKEIDISRFHVTAGHLRRWITEPNATSRYEAHDGGPVNDTHLNLVLPAESIQTFEITGLTER